MLRVDSSKRPDTNQLIQSKMFQIYTEKLNSLESVDMSFKKTLNSPSPDRTQISTITNNLLTQLRLPENDITSLTAMMPKTNYDSVGNSGKSVSLTKVVVEDVQGSSRKLQHLRQKHQQSRQN